MDLFKIKSHLFVIHANPLAQIAKNLVQPQIAPPVYQILEQIYIIQLYLLARGHVLVDTLIMDQMNARAVLVHVLHVKLMTLIV